jgi:two-component system, OmpR family, copper resistance phosphate regulon response regulator CusR
VCSQVTTIFGRILIVEDNSKLADALVCELKELGYEVTLARTGEDAFFLVHNAHPDLVLLDLTLPGRGGLEILAQIRAQSIDFKVLILTSHNSVEDRVIGLEAGADDYLGKPFSFPELLARIKSLLRRNQVAASSTLLQKSNASSASLQMVDITIDLETRRVIRSGVKLELTPREYDLLLYLLEHRNSTVSREMLAKDVWRETSRFTPIDNVINVQMMRLRRKLDDPFPVKLLHTIHGVGFILREPKL